MAKSKKKPDRYTRDNGLMAKQVTINGKRKVFYGHSENEICQKMLEYKGEVKAGPMFSDVADEWYAKKQSEVRHGTLVCYGPAVERAKRAFAGRRIKELRAEDVSAFMQNMRVSGLATKTISNAHCVLNMIFEYACVRYGLTSNPSSLVTTPKGTKTVRKPPNAAQLKAIKGEIETELDAHTLTDGAVMAAVYLYTGVRRGEGLALRFGDIDLESGMISVSRSVEHQNNRAVIGDTKTENGVRKIPLVPQLKAVLLELGNQAAETYVFGLGAAPLTNRQFEYRWVSFCRACGLAQASEEQRTMNRRGQTKDGMHLVWRPMVTPHQLRHEYATSLYNAGVPMDIAVRMMGHADSVMIRRVYLDVNQSMIENAGAKYAAYMASTE